MNFEKYLQESEYINFSDPKISSLAKELAKECKDDEEIAKKCFLYVRDEIKHIGDHKIDRRCIKASEVLEHKVGWCYAKALLLAALLRLNGIPTALYYQQLSCGEYKDDVYCLHGLNAVYLQKYGWYRVDARGYKEGVDAQFCPPVEKLAFELDENEYDLASFYTDPLPEVVHALQTFPNYESMVHNFPLVDRYICGITHKDAQRLHELSTALLPHIFNSDTPEWFLEDFTSTVFKERIENGEYKHYGYVIGSKIVGYIVIKQDTHLYHLFVDEKYQKQGIAKKLWEFVNENLEFDTMTTNSSINAIKVYEAFGFEKVDGIQVYNTELKYQQMLYKAK